MTTTRSASVFSRPRVRVNASSWSAGRHPRPEAVEPARHPHRLDEAGERGPRALPVHVAADDDRRTLGGGDRAQPPRSTSAGSGSTPRGTVPFASGAVAEPKITSIGKSTKTGPRCGVSRRRDRVLDLLRGVAGRRHGAGRLRDRRDDRHVVELLQRTRAPACLRCAATQHDERRAVEVRGGDRAHAVGDAGPGSEHGEARACG